MSTDSAIGARRVSVSGVNGAKLAIGEMTLTHRVSFNRASLQRIVGCRISRSVEGLRCVIRNGRISTAHDVNAADNRDVDYLWFFHRI